MPFFDIVKQLKKFGFKYTYKDVTFVAATTGAVAAKRLFNVTGIVIVFLIPECKTDLTSSGAATIKAGTKSSTGLTIAATTATAIDAGELWLDATPAKAYDFTDALPQGAIVNNDNLAYEIETAAISGGMIRFHLLWAPVTKDGMVTPAGVNESP